MLRGAKERANNLYTNKLAQAVAPLDRFFTNLGRRWKKGGRDKGVYPPKEIHTPTPAESQQAFTEYMTDAHRRSQLGQLNMVRM
jgi:hypothetical protein